MPCMHIKIFTLQIKKKPKQTKKPTPNKEQKMNKEANKKPQTELFLICSDLSDTDVILLLILRIHLCILYLYITTWYPKIKIKQSKLSSKGH